MLNEYNFIGFHREFEDYGFLSNWYQAKFEYAGKEYANSEQYMMYKKAELFSQFEIADQIMKTDDPEKCQQLGGTKFPNWDGDLWSKVKYRVVRRGVKAKFVQNPKLLLMLFETGKTLLAECSASDKNWGIGIGMKDENRFDVLKWQGENLLGRILMDVREELSCMSLMAPGDRKIKYRDVSHVKTFREWEMTFGELMQIPKYRKIVEGYLETIEKFYGYTWRKKMMQMSPKDYCDSQDRAGLNYPFVNINDMKQDLYETANDMWVLGSGFDAPVYGERLPEGAKLVKQENGCFKVVLPGDEENNVK